MAPVLDTSRRLIMRRENELEDRQLGTAIMDRLAKTRLAPGSTVWATVFRGYVTLNGEVGSWKQRDALEHSVLHVAGLRGLKNLLKVKPDVTLRELQQAITQAHGSPG